MTAFGRLQPVTTLKSSPFERLFSVKAAVGAHRFFCFYVGHRAKLVPTLFSAPPAKRLSLLPRKSAVRANDREHVGTRVAKKMVGPVGLEPTTKGL